MINISAYAQIPKGYTTLESFKVENPKASAFNQEEPFFYTAFEHGEFIYAPRNSIPARFTRACINNTVEGKSVDFPSMSVVLKPFQQRLIKSIFSNFDKGLYDQTTKAPCGSGKTVMALYAMWKLGKKSVILVPNSDLIKQWMDRLNRFFPGIEVGLLDGSTKIIKDVTICSIPTVMRLNPFTNELSSAKLKIYNQLQDVGTVILDEVHRNGADKWATAIGVFPAKVRLGFSATPYRKDNKHIAIFGHCGRVMQEMDLSQLAALKEVVLPSVFLVRYRNARSYINRWNGMFNYSKAVTDMSVDPFRNALMLKMVEDAVSHGRKCLIIAARVEHFLALYNQLSHHSPGVICGKESLKKFRDVGLPVQSREEALQSNVIIGNIQLVQEGLDCPELDTLFLYVPVSDPAIIEQILGRLARLDPDKKPPMLVDFVDTEYKLKDFVKMHKGNLRPLQIMALNRFNTYNNIGCNILNFSAT